MDCSFGCADYWNPLLGSIEYPDGTVELKNFSNKCYLAQAVCTNPQNGNTTRIIRI